MKWCEKTRRILDFFANFLGLSVRYKRAFRLVGNGLHLGEVAEIEAKMFSFAQKFNRRITVEFSTKPAILPNC